MKFSNDFLIKIISFVVIGCCISNCHGRRMTQCEFVREFTKYSPGIDRDNLNKWTCLVEHQSNFTSTKRHVDADGTIYYGLFQINDRYLCARNVGDRRVCGIPCRKFEDDYFGDDFKCARKVYNVYLRRFADGFGEWPSFNVSCASPRDYASECMGLAANKSNEFPVRFDDEVERPVVHDQKDDVASRSGEGKTYDRCEFVKELRDKHNVPDDELATWLCIAEQHSQLKTSRGSGSEYGIFQINNYWCALDGESEKDKGCKMNCSKLLDDNIEDDFACARLIHAETQKTSGEVGFTAWNAYVFCKEAASLPRNCLSGSNTTAEDTSNATATRKNVGKIYDRCELARELYLTYDFPMDEIPTWVCIAHHESRYNTSAVGMLNADNSRDHGLFQLSDKWWCYNDDKVVKGCGVPCSQFEDDDIRDDVACVRRVFEETKMFDGNGFNAWVVYKEQCMHQTVGYVQGCFDDENDISDNVIELIPAQGFIPLPLIIPAQMTSTTTQSSKDTSERRTAYSRCELALELQSKHNVPDDEIADLVCIAAAHNSILITSVHDQQRFGIFQIDYDSCMNGDAGCPIDCNKLLDDDISDDVECARAIRAKHGFSKWPDFQRDCQGRSSELVEDCFEDDAIFPTLNFVGARTSRKNQTTTSATPTPTTLNIRPVTAAMIPVRRRSKTYTPCSLALELRDQHNVPANEISDLVCMAGNYSTLSTSTQTSQGYGVFHIDRDWCAESWKCSVSCNQLLDDDISDDVSCARKILAELNLSPVGDSAAKCRTRITEECFPEAVTVKQWTSEMRIQSESSPETPKPIAISRTTSPLLPNSGKIYERCELARELYLIHDFPMDEIPTWVCIAHHESRYNTSAVGMLNADNSRDHGLFQLSDKWWCSDDDKEVKGCGVPCSHFEDDDIKDDVACIRRVFEETEKFDGNGFNAWVVYKEQCIHETVGYVQDCFEDENDTSDNAIGLIPAQSFTPLPPAIPVPVFPTTTQSSEVTSGQRSKIQSESSTNAPTPITTSTTTTATTPPLLTNYLSQKNVEQFLPIPLNDPIPLPMIVPQPQPTIKKPPCNSLQSFSSNAQSPTEQIRTWICVAQQRTRFNPNGIDFHVSKAFDFFCKFKAPDDCIDTDEDVASVASHIIADTSFSRQKKQADFNSPSITATRFNDNPLNLYTIPEVEPSTTRPVVTTLDPTRTNENFAKLVEEQRSKLFAAYRNPGSYR